MREDCTHYESRTYEGGEVARFCTRDLAPEAPWRCPDPCAGYERILLIGGDFEAGSLAATPPAGEAPAARPGDIAAVLDDAEDIVLAAAPEVLAELDRQQARRLPWWRRWGRRGGGGDDGFRLSRR
jgi:hypothetical protein